jgi:hypothetical protein
METSRCTDLIAKGMFFKVDEMWISDQPFLAMTYLAVYAPWITRYEECMIDEVNLQADNERLWIVCSTSKTYNLFDLDKSLKMWSDRQE